MKKLTIVLVSIFLILTVSSTFVLAAEGDDKMTFAFSTSTMNNSFMIALSDTLEEEIEADGHEYYVMDPQYDQAKQISMIEDAVTQGVDMIFVLPVDTEGVRQGLLYAQENDVPVIVVDTAVADDDLVISTVISDSYNAGYLNGVQMAKDYPNGGKIAIMNYPSNAGCVQREQGFLDGLGENRDKFEVVARFDGGAALEVTLPIAEDVIQNNPDLDAAFCINDPSSLGFYAAARAAGKADQIDIYSIDASPDGKKALLNGNFEMIVAQSPINIAKTSYRVAKDYFAGKEVKDLIHVETFEVTEEMAKEIGVDNWQ